MRGKPLSAMLAAKKILSIEQRKELKEMTEFGAVEGRMLHDGAEAMHLCERMEQRHPKPR
jgi:hypothetical protein